MDISTQFLVLIPVVLGLVQVAKTIGLADKFAPVLSLVFGVLGICLLGGFSGTLIIQGIIIGLSASGLWSGTKATIIG